MPLRILVTSTPGAGHVQALLPLAVALDAAGHEVCWATAKGPVPGLAGRRFINAAAGLSVAERQARFRPHLAEVMTRPPRQRRAGMFSGLFARVAAPVMRADLEPVFDRFLEPEMWQLLGRLDDRFPRWWALVCGQMVTPGRRGRPR